MKRQILIVDDEEPNRELIATYLEEQGLGALGACSGREALDLLDRETVDLVLLDVLMPEMSGLEVLLEIREKWTPDHLPVIMVTGQGRSEQVVEALELGANDHVAKPVSMPVLLARIRAVLRTCQAAEERAAGGFPGPGAILGGRLKLERVIGSGGFAVVFRALHLELERRVAVKVLKSVFEDKKVAEARFRREGRSMIRLQHANCVAVYDYAVSSGGYPYLVMELLKGVNLERELARRGALSEARAWSITLSVCRALAAAHEIGIVHRDVKPSNIFLHRPEEGGEVVKILDFGIARLAGESERLTGEGRIVGTPSYMAPERIRDLPFDGRADIYSVGIVLLEMLSGRTLFSVKAGDRKIPTPVYLEADPISVFDLPTDLAPELVAILRAMLATEPSRRSTAPALVEELEQMGPLPGGAASRRASEGRATKVENTTLLIDAGDNPETGDREPSGEDP